MGIYIKGMEMPKQGRVTLQIGADGAVYIVDKCEITAEKYEKNFEVFEVPTPHGRLIDADEMLQFLVETFGEEVKEGFAWKTISEHCITIIEADGTQND